jgi:hypothetical protein
MPWADARRAMPTPAEVEGLYHLYWLLITASMLILGLSRRF